MKFIRNPSLTNPAFLTMTCSQVCIPLLFAFLSNYPKKKIKKNRKKNKKKKKKKHTHKKRKKTRKLHPSGIETGIPRSPVLYFTTHRIDASVEEL